MQEKEWNIKARSEVCSACETPFEDGDDFTAVLSLVDGECVRTDVCDRCWDDDKYRTEAISVWRSVFKVPPAKPEGPLKKETSESLLRKLIETNEESQRDVVFVLAVDLERRRILEERDVEILADGSKNRIYEHKKTGEAFIVLDPDLNLRELEDVQGKVLELLLSKEQSSKSGPESAPESSDE